MIVNSFFCNAKIVFRWSRTRRTSDRQHPLFRLTHERTNKRTKIGWEVFRWKIAEPIVLNYFILSRPNSFRRCENASDQRVSNTLTLQQLKRRVRWFAFLISLTRQKKGTVSPPLLIKWHVSRREKLPRQEGFHGRHRFSRRRRRRFTPKAENMEREKKKLNKNASYAGQQLRRFCGLNAPSSRSRVIPGVEHFVLFFFFRFA